MKSIPAGKIWKFNGTVQTKIHDSFYIFCEKFMQLLLVCD